MSNKSNATVATMGIDTGKNSFHVVGLGRARVLHNVSWRGTCGPSRTAKNIEGISPRGQTRPVLR
jgi:hypothetical protein